MSSSVRFSHFKGCSSLLFALVRTLVCLDFTSCSLLLLKVGFFAISRNVSNFYACRIWMECLWQKSWKSQKKIYKQRTLDFFLPNHVLKLYHWDSLGLSQTQGTYNDRKSNCVRNKKKKYTKSKSSPHESWDFSSHEILSVSNVSSALLLI